MSLALVALVAVAVAIALMLNRDGSTSSASRSSTLPPGSAPISGTSTSLDPAVVAARQIASVKTLSATVSYHAFAFKDSSGENSTSDVTTEFRASSSGDIWTKQVSANEAIEQSYNATTSEERSYSYRYKGANKTIEPLNAALITNAVDTDRLALIMRLGAHMSSARALIGSGDPRLVETTFAGRPAWQFVATKSIDMLGIVPDRYVVTLDRETAVPVHVEGTRDGRPFDEVTVSALQVNPHLTASDFVVTIPPNVKVSKIDNHYKRVAIGEVKDVVDYEPFVPGALPEGFTLSSVMVNKDAGQSGPEGINEINRNLVALTYRRGFETLVVSTRSSTHGATDWVDPLAYEGEPEHDDEKLELGNGSFKGLQARIVVGSSSEPHLWVVGSRWLLTVSGDVGRNDLIKVAESVVSPSAAR